MKPRYQQLFTSAQQLRNFIHLSSTSATIASTAFQSSLLRILPVLSETPSLSMPGGEKLTACGAVACGRKRGAELLCVVHGQDLCALSRNDPTLFKHTLIKSCIWLFGNKCNLFSYLLTPTSTWCLDRQCAYTVFIKKIPFQGSQESFCL